MKKVLTLLDDYFEDTIILVLFSFLIINVLVEVFRRYVLNDSGQYSEEIARYTLIAIIYLGVPYALKKRCHIFCDVLPSTISPKTSYCVNLISNLFFLLMCIIMVKSGWDLVQQQIMTSKITPAMYVPMWWFTATLPFGFALGIVRLLQVMYEDYKHYPNPVKRLDHQAEFGLDGSI